MTDDEILEKAFEKLKKIKPYDIAFESRSSAEKALDHLKQIINEYGSASVSDFYEHEGVRSITGDHTKGWTNLDYVEIVDFGGFWCIAFPEPKTIDSEEDKDEN